MSAPRMTSTDPLKSKKQSFENTMLHNRLNHILTTCRCIPTASWQNRRDHILIDQNWKYGYLSEVGF